jgi:hypothetical protein
MSQQPYVPPGAVPERSAPGPVDYEYEPDTSVRRVLDAGADRERPWGRWGAIVAGVFVTAGSTILLSMLGLCFGVTALNPLSASPTAGLTAGTAIWWALQSLLTLFLGGYAASRLWGSSRRSEGVTAGILTWAVSLVGLMWLLGSVASLAVTGAAGAASAASNMPSMRPSPGSVQVSPSDAEAGQRAAAGTLGYLFAVTAASLLTAIGGGAMAAASRLHTRGRVRHG